MKTPLKLSTRILLGYLVPCLAFTIAVIAVYLESARLQETIAQTERAVSIVEHGQRLQLHVALMQRNARGLMLRPGDQESRADAWLNDRAEADKAIAELRRLVRDPAQLALLERLVEATRVIADVTRRQVERVRAGAAAEVIKEFQAGQSDEVFRAFDALARQFFDKEEAIETGYRAAMIDGVAAVKSIVLVGALLAIVVSLVAGWLLATKTATSLRELISVVAASSTQIAATTEEHEGAMTQQASAVTETTATVEEMVATARTNAEQAELATQSANDAQTTTRAGLELVTHNEADMVAMEDTMNRIAQQIIGLSERAGQIGEIARVVGELAAETNMLALNAAVEAARAGEQGKGFAVVASEIRKLADQSKKSAERANQIVVDIQNATNGMVMAAEDGSKTTHAAAESAHLASQAFEKVIHLADAVVQNAQQVLLNSKQQAVALSQIDIAMKNINNGAREMATGTVQMRDGMARLSGVAGNLNRLL